MLGPKSSPWKRGCWHARFQVGTLASSDTVEWYVGSLLVNIITAYVGRNFNIPSQIT